jgi:fatty acid desaturase
MTPTIPHDVFSRWLRKRIIGATVWSAILATLAILNAIGDRPTWWLVVLCSIFAGGELFGAIHDGRVLTIHKRMTSMTPE